MRRLYIVAVIYFGATFCIKAAKENVLNILELPWQQTTCSFDCEINFSLTANDGYVICRNFAERVGEQNNSTYTYSNYKEIDNVQMPRTIIWRVSNRTKWSPFQIVPSFAGWVNVKILQISTENINVDDLIFHGCNINSH